MQGQGKTRRGMAWTAGDRQAMAQLGWTRLGSAHKGTHRPALQRHGTARIGATCMGATCIGAVCIGTEGHASASIGMANFTKTT